MKGFPDLQAGRFRLFQTGSERTQGPRTRTRALPRVKPLRVTPAYTSLRDSSLPIPTCNALGSGCSQI
jgi:hypothetical protein